MTMRKKKKKRNKYKLNAKGVIVGSFFMNIQLMTTNRKK